MNFSLRFGLQYFQLFSTFFLMDIQIHFSIDSASQLFTVGKFPICVSQPLIEILYKTDPRLARC